MTCNTQTVILKCMLQTIWMYNPPRKNYGTTYTVIFQQFPGKNSRELTTCSAGILSTYGQEGNNVSISCSTGKFLITLSKGYHYETSCSSLHWWLTLPRRGIQCIEGCCFPVKQEMTHPVLSKLTNKAPIHFKLNQHVNMGQTRPAELMMHFAKPVWICSVWIILCNILLMEPKQIFIHASPAFCPSLIKLDQDSLILLMWHSLISALLNRAWNFILFFPWPGSEKGSIYFLAPLF
jgi:hypothetical protein